MPAEIHCCSKYKCTGENYGEIFLNCSFCQNPIFIQCMRKKYENTKNILAMFGLAKKHKNGSFDLLFEDTEKTNFFKACFSENSPFAVHCDVCANNFKKEKDDEIYEIANDDDDDYKISGMISKEIKKMKTEIISEIKDIINTTEKVTETSSQSEILRLYLSTKEEDSTTDKIISLIMENSDIDNIETFSVNPLMNPRIAARRGHQSYEIITVSKKVYDIILNHCTWPDNFTIRKFDEKMKPKLVNTNKKHNQNYIKKHNNEYNYNNRYQHNFNNEWNQNNYKNSRNQHNNRNRWNQHNHQNNKYYKRRYDQRPMKYTNPHMNINHNFPFWKNRSQTAMDHRMNQINQWNPHQNQNQDAYQNYNPQLDHQTNQYHQWNNPYHSQNLGIYQGYI